MTGQCLRRTLVASRFEGVPASSRLQPCRSFTKVALRSCFRGHRSPLLSGSRTLNIQASSSKDDVPSVSTEQATTDSSSPSTTTNTATLIPPPNGTSSDSESSSVPQEPSSSSSHTTSSSNGTNNSSPKSSPAKPNLDGSLASTDTASDISQENTAPLCSSAESNWWHLNSGVVATLGFGGGLLGLVVAGTIFRAPIRTFLEFFIDAVEHWGPLGYVAYGVVYTGLEVLAVPAIPLTMTAGVIFGPTTGTIIVSLSATTAATIAFLIARYMARERVMKFAKGNAKFAAIDAAIGKDSLKVVTLLRLSPLLPLAISNYLYGLTSVDLASYVVGSFLGMLPGTYAYVSAGHLGKAVLTEGEGMLTVEAWQVGVGIAATVLAIGVIGRLAKNALEDVQDSSN